MKNKEIKLSEMTTEDFLYRLDKINFAYAILVVIVIINALIKNKIIMLTIGIIYLLAYMLINKSIKRVRKEIKEAKKDEESKIQHSKHNTSTNIERQK